VVRPYSAVIALGGYILLGAASANAADLIALRAHIPFTFKAGSATLPPGQYFLRFDGVELPGVLRVRGQDGREGAFALAHGAYVPDGSGDEPKLVFERDGSKYVLSQVLDPGVRYGIEVSKPRPGGEPERTEPATD
jgi:hypothetical protein